jgi:hypothetical protein
MNKEENTLIKKYINLLKKINNNSNNKKKELINEKIKLLNNLFIKYNKLSYKKSNKINLNKKKISNKQKGGAENIGYIAGDLFKSFFNLGKEVFNEIDSLTKLPGRLAAIPDTKVTSKPTPPVAYKNPDIPNPVINQE